MDWTSRSGFLEKKSNHLKIWNVRWMVLENRVLLSYTDETQSTLTGKFTIDDQTIIETMPHEPTRKCMFILRNSHKNETLTMNAANAVELEHWMISLIQAICGSFKAAENFETGENFHSPSDAEDDRMSTAIRQSYMSDGMINYPITGYLKKQGHSTGSWKYRYFVLDESPLFRCYSNSSDTSPEAMRAAIILDASSRVVVLPPGFYMQRYSFTLVSTHSNRQKPSSLRLATNSEDELMLWVAAIRKTIGRCSIVEVKQRVTSSITTQLFNKPFAAKKERSTGLSLASPRVTVSSPSSEYSPGADDVVASYDGPVAGPGTPAVTSVSPSPASVATSTTASLRGQAYPPGSERISQTSAQAIKSAVGEVIPTHSSSSISSSYTKLTDKSQMDSSISTEGQDTSTATISSSGSDGGSITSSNGKSYYVNDSTLWGRLYKSDESDPVVAEEINQLYLEYFTRPVVGRPDLLVVSVYENQRYIPLSGWNCLHLLVGERAKLSDRNGVKFPNRYLSRTSAPFGYGWPRKVEVGIDKKTETSHAAASVHATEVNRGRKQVTETTIDDDGRSDDEDEEDVDDSEDEFRDSQDAVCSPQETLRDNAWFVDGDGGDWHYGTSFQSFPSENEPAALVPSSYHVVRRRKWVRVAQLRGAELVCVDGGAVSECATAFPDNDHEQSGERLGGDNHNWHEDMARHGIGFDEEEEDQDYEYDGRSLWGRDTSMLGGTLESHFLPSRKKSPSSSDIAAGSVGSSSSDGMASALLAAVAAGPLIQDQPLPVSTAQSGASGTILTGGNNGGGGAAAVHSTAIRGGGRGGGGEGRTTAPAVVGPVRSTLVDFGIDITNVNDDGLTEIRLSEVVVRIK